MSTRRRQSGGRGEEEPHHQVLSAAVAAVLSRVDAHASGTAVPTAPGRGGRRPVAVSALDTLCSCFGLTPFERDVLVLAAAPEIDPTAAARLAAASGDPARAYPTFSLALAAFEEPHWSALTPVGPLRRFRLVELADETSPTGSRLRIDERILHFLVGVPYLDARLHGLVSRVRAPEELPDAHERCAVTLASGWSAAEPDGLPQAELFGADRRTRWEIAAAGARRAGLSLYAASAEDLPTEPAEREQLARLWQREAVLTPAALLIEAGEPGRERTGGPGALEALLAALAVPVVLSGTEPLPGPAARARLRVPELAPEEQLGLWTAAMDGVAGIGEPELRGLVAQFSLPAHVIRSAAGVARRAAAEGVGDVSRLAWQAGLTEARMSLDELGRRVEPGAGWDDLVLEERQRDILREIVAHVRRRGTVYQEWGFESVLRRGLGVTALFAGGSGTGKTLAAEVIAGQLGVDLFVIDLSQVVSKYIGETEKNLRRVFDAAERGGALLLFDEADALFGKRSEVKDSHDRYANLEVSYLLMRMEEYRGLAVLTTNMKKALDPAFMRRIRFVVDFPFPGTAERAEIWRRVIPKRTPSEGLDAELLAQLTVAGGSIRNIALAGAFLAADQDSPLRMRHLLAAARTEYLKLERSLTPSEVRGWV
ncbi:ATP-binding protein [Kitasatospora sp. NPDC056783]|uniref:ATP-binding protein n=1 Tax=Kitasatospora sp. NPDC056783 TaxID=3345943 RepID=UPI0036AF8F49